MHAHHTKALRPQKRSVSILESSQQLTRLIPRYDGSIHAETAKTLYSQLDMILLPLPAQPIRPAYKVFGHHHILFKYHVGSFLSNWTIFRSRQYEQPHVLKPKIHEFYDNRDPNTLWWKVATQPMKLKRVVRSHWSRRLRRIFREELYSRGYDETGKPLPLEKLPKGVTLRTAPLRGTLEIEPMVSLITQKDTAVKRLVKIQLDRVMEAMKEWPIDKRTGTYQNSPP